MAGAISMSDTKPKIMDDYDGAVPAGDTATPESPILNADSGSTGSAKVSIEETAPLSLPVINPEQDAGTVGSELSPVLQEMQGDPTTQVNEQIFDEIPVEVCGQMYQTLLEVGFTLKNKGMPMRELPATRVKTQGEIIYGIMKKNQINIKHIDLFMLGAGMMGDWKYIGSFSEEQKAEAASTAEPDKEKAYGELP